MLFKEIVDGRTNGRTTDNGRRTLKDHKSSLSTSCSGELKKHYTFTDDSLPVLVRRGGFLVRYGVPSRGSGVQVSSYLLEILVLEGLH